MTDELFALFDFGALVKMAHKTRRMASSEIIQRVNDEAFALLSVERGTKGRGIRREGGRSVFCIFWDIRILNYIATTQPYDYQGFDFHIHCSQKA
ncbi:hypothetical protein O6P43_026694 [Quillaja saponaria]|uniref:Uncharacterized protein n=1 Tax=Quillaja saponaria TaxID=32244 RepID=A0AAD7L413_QUISA|nr:hypothetical protein O6P43_026694 [Quillaja saponaria]